MNYGVRVDKDGEFWAILGDANGVPLSVPSIFAAKYMAITHARHAGNGFTYRGFCWEHDGPEICELEQAREAEPFPPSKERLVVR